ncbi:5'-methylthioadenosine/adenosylhomocysteine nucleosidase [Falseniella ignava]
MKIGIIAAMPEELAYLIQELEQGQKVQILGNAYHTGKIGSVEVVLVESGIGKVMSAMSVAVLADRFQVDAVINTGSAGAVANGIAVGDVVIADKLAYHDVDVTAFGYEYGQMARQPLYFEADGKFISLIQESLSKLNQTWHLGLIATGDSFVAGDDKIARIKSHFPQVLAVEMEGAAIGQAAQALGLPFLVIRAMSDNANHEASISFDEFIIEAGRRSAQVILAFLKALN